MAGIVKGPHGKAVEASQDVARDWPIGIGVETPHGRAVLIGYSSSGFDGITGAWVEVGGWGGDRHRVKFDDMSVVERVPDVGHPRQPIEMVGEVVRFRKNNAVDALYRAAAAGDRFDMNDAWAGFSEGEFTLEDVAQLYQLVGMSVCGFEEAFHDHCPVRVDEYAKRALYVYGQHKKEKA
jgi:hypothetical protein